MSKVVFPVLRRKNETNQNSALYNTEKTNVPLK